MQEITFLEKAPALKIALSGEIDSGNADEFYAEVERVYAPAPRDVVFDCGKLEFIDSTTLGTFVKICKRVQADGHTMRIEALPPRLKKLFAICALDTLMEIV